MPNDLIITSILHTFGSCQRTSSVSIDTTKRPPIAVEHMIVRSTSSTLNRWTCFSTLGRGILRDSCSGPLLPGRFPVQAYSRKKFLLPEH